MSNIVCGPAQDRPLRSAERLESNFQVAELGKRYTMENSHGQSSAPNGAMGLKPWGSLASKLAVYPMALDPHLWCRSLSMTKIAKA